MSVFRYSTCAWLIGAMVLSLVGTSEAQITVEQRREFLLIRKDVGEASTLVRRKKLDEAEKLLSECEKRLSALAAAAKLQPNDPALAGVQALIDRQRGLIAKQKGDDVPSDAAKELTYVEHIQPLLAQRCGNCHGENNPRAGLTVTSVAGLQKGGSSGPVVVAGNAAASLLARRLIAPAPQRMPKNGPSLSRDDIERIALWINQGAKIGEVAEKDKPKPKVEIAMATGNETVSFSKDIAPFMVNLCVRCHSGNNPRSGFSLETFEKLMQGGDSGQVVIPGDLDASRLWDLAGKQDPIKMPPGQALMTRTNWNHLQTWIKEGAKYDGGDATKPLRELVPTEGEVRAMELAKLSPAEFNALRKDRAAEMWDRALPKEEPQQVETAQFLVMGNVDANRLKQIGDWAEQTVKELRTLLRDQADPMWKGKLTLFVFRDRFSFEEFNLIILRRETPRELTGHAVVTANYEEAYAALLDTGDQGGADDPTMRINLTEQLTSACLKRDGGDKLPEWLLRGTGLSLAAVTEGTNPYISGLPGKAKEAMRFVAKPEDLLAGGTFSPTTVGAVGQTLVSFLRKAGGDSKFGQFVAELKKGNKMADVVQSVYRTDAKSLATAYFVELQKLR